MLRKRNEPKFDFDDILLEAAGTSFPGSRSEISLTYKGELGLPLFTAPMDTVVNNENAKFFRGAGIKVVFPRTEIGKIDFSKSNALKDFVSYGIEDFERIYIRDRFLEAKYVLIDIANGHMKRLLDSVEESKKIHGRDLVLMVGNVANPLTYERLSKAGADLIRTGIGNGGACTTTVHTGVGYPMASLIAECYEKSGNHNNPAKIVADGGFKSYSDIIKALALGADYVMLGSIFNKAMESAGETFSEEEGVVDQYKVRFERDKYWKRFRGMSTKDAQLAMGKEILKTSEGIHKTQKVEYTLNGWVENFRSYLSSTMSYTGKSSLEDFVGNVDYNLITQNAFRRFDK
jgi:IMP dehydrogenase/GMP reductase